MEQHDGATERIHRKFEEAIGEPEATMVMDRLVTRDEIRGIVREEMSTQVDLLRTELSAANERLRSEFHSVARQNLATTLTAVGVLNAVVFAALGLFLS